MSQAISPQLKPTSHLTQVDFIDEFIVAKSIDPMIVHKGFKRVVGDTDRSRGRSLDRIDVAQQNVLLLEKSPAVRWIARGAARIADRQRNPGPGFAGEYPRE